MNCVGNELPTLRLLKVKSQTKLERWETVYNFEVEDYVTYHIGEFGVWVHNQCCEKLVPGTPEHKQARWEEYQSNPNSSNWSYERWSNTYDANMTKATQANKARDNYHSGLGWGETEVTVKVSIDGVDYNRRLDIADEANRKAIEHKTGYQSRTEDILWELKRDKELVRRGWKIEWVFDGEASKTLIEDLKKAGIKVKINK